MRKAYKFRLSPTKKQEKVLFWTLTRCRELVRHFWRLFDSFAMKERLGANDL